MKYAGTVLGLMFALTALGQGKDTLFLSKPIPDSELCHLSLSYCDKDGKTQQGEMVCNHTIATDLIDIFRQLWKAGYRIERMELVDKYDGDDERSMSANNTSCYNNRTIAGTNTLSKHARGLAIDVNPLYNPYVKNGNVSPKGGKKWAFNRSKRRDIPFKIDHNDLCYRLFHEHGFRWGGDWKSCKDYQHFEK